MTNDYLLLICS